MKSSKTSVHRKKFNQSRAGPKNRKTTLEPLRTYRRSTIFQQTTTQLIQQTLLPRIEEKK